MAQNTVEFFSDGELKVKKKREVRIISLDDLPDDALVVSFGGMGSPHIRYERLYTLHEGIQTIRKIEHELSKESNKKVEAILPTEGAGANGLYPFFLAAKLGIPVVDADCKGRALPKADMITPNFFGKFDNILAVLSNGLSEAVIHAKDFEELEREARRLTSDMGGSVSKAQLPLTGREVKALTVKGTLSIIKKIGQNIRSTESLPFKDRLRALNEVLANTDYKKATVICEGKIEAFFSPKDGSLRVGCFIVKDLSQNKYFGIGFQNENLFVRRCSDNVNIALTPKIINVIDKNTFEIISCENLKFGQDVVIVKMSPPKMLKRAEALKVIRAEDKTLNYLYDLINGLLRKIRAID